MTVFLCCDSDLGIADEKMDSEEGEITLHIKEKGS